MTKVFVEAAWQDYLYWLETDKTKLRKINELIQAIERDPFKGIGKPEALRFEFQGCWSRRIDSKNRLVYRVTKDQLVILSCKDHYKNV